MASGSTEFLNGKRELLQESKRKATRARIYAVLKYINNSLTKAVENQYLNCKRVAPYHTMDAVSSLLHGVRRRGRRKTRDNHTRDQKHFCILCHL